MMADDKRLTTVPKGNVPQQYNSYQQNQPKAPIDPQQARDSYLQMTDDDYFAASGGKRAPSARLVRYWAKRDRLNSKILDFGKDSEKAWAKVKVWSGPEQNPTLVREDGVCILYKSLLVAAIYEAIQNGKWIVTGFANGKPDRKKVFPNWELGPDGYPIIMDEKHGKAVMFAIGKEYAEKVKFAERAAISSAEKRAFLKLMNKDDEHEHDAEEHIAGEKPPSEGNSDLMELIGEIRKGIMELVKGDKDKGAQALKDITSLINANDAQYPIITASVNIKSIDHAMRILDAIEEMKKIEEKPVEVDDASRVES